MLEIKTDDGKNIRARAIPGNMSRCGYCDMILLDGQTFLMLDEPYCCIVHETCMNFFEWDGKPRCEPAKNVEERRKKISQDEETLGNYMSRPHWKMLRIPNAVREAIVRFYFLGLTLRQNYAPTKKREAIIEKLSSALNLFGEAAGEAGAEVESVEAGSAADSSQVESTPRPPKKTTKPILAEKRAGKRTGKAPSAEPAPVQKKDLVGAEKRDPAAAEKTGQAVTEESIETKKTESPKSEKGGEAADPEK